MQRLFFIIAILLSTPVFGQSPPFPFNNVPAELPLPEGKDTWVVDVVTRGGLDGRGTGDLRINSQGKLSSSFRDVTRDKNVKKEALQTFAEFIPPATKAVWGDSSLGTCMDCIAILVRLKIREPAGTARTFVAYWDVTTQRRVPEEILRMYNAAIELGKSGLRTNENGR